MARRAEKEVAQTEKGKRNVDLERWRLLAVRTAENAGFWYTENLCLGWGLLVLPSIREEKVAAVAAAILVVDGLSPH